MNGTVAAKHILVIDDDPTVTLLVAESLEPRGYRVSAAGDGVQGLRTALEELPDLLLLDVNLPGRDGFAVCEALRRAERGRYLPIMMLTALDDVQSVERAYRAGADDFFVKPINWALLHHRISFLLRSVENLAALRRSEERYALAVLGANDGLWDWDLVSGRVYYSSRWLDMVGLGTRQQDVAPVLQTWLDLVHAADRDAVERQLQAARTDLGRRLVVEYRVRGADGAERWMLSRGRTLADESGRPVRMAGSQTDITTRKQAESDLAHQALHDTLTGLPNRCLFLDRLQHSLERCSRDPEFGFALFFLDLDRFKQVNDSLGHLQGDRMLQEVGRRLSQAMRGSDTLARLGGDEFTLLCEGCRSPRSVTQMVNRIREALFRPMVLAGQEISIRASIGVALSASGYGASEDMLRDADSAMYRAKEQGTGRCEIFDPSMRARVVGRLQLESELAVAPEREELRLYYQPVLALADRRVLGVEALVRWQHPTRGLLLPADFLDVAQDAGLMVAMGRWVLGAALAQLAAWRTTLPAALGWFVSCNLAAVEMADSLTPGLVAKALASHGLNPGDLRIEIGEQVLLQEERLALENLRQLQEMGVRLCIDEFGGGYSSFRHLHRFHFDALKIDSGFLDDLTDERCRREIVRALITMAHNLGMSVAAQGVEDRLTSDALTDLACDSGQGFLFAEPLPADELLERIGSFQGTQD